MAQMSQSEPQAYTGVANLEAMEEARNYNSFLIDSLLEYTRPSELIVDFGAGIGTFSKALVKRGLRVVAVEPDNGMRAAMAAEGLDVRDSIGALEPHSVDFIYSFNVLEHIEDDAGVLHELAGKLRPGGRVLIYVPAFQVLFSSMDSLVGHHRRYDRNGLAELVGRVGLQVEVARYVDCIGFAASLAYKHLGRGDGNISPGSVRAYDRFLFPLSHALDPLFSRLLGKNLLLVARAA
jgi:SAM-dependent methyltransferase